MLLASTTIYHIKRSSHAAINSYLRSSATLTKRLRGSTTTKLLPVQEFFQLERHPDFANDAYDPKPTIINHQGKRKSHSYSLALKTEPRHYSEAPPEMSFRLECSVPIATDVFLRSGVWMGALTFWGRPSELLRLDGLNLTQVDNFCMCL